MLIVVKEEAVARMLVTTCSNEETRMEISIGNSAKRGVRGLARSKVRLYEHL